MTKSCESVHSIASSVIESNNDFRSMLNKKKKQLLSYIDAKEKNIEALNGKDTAEAKKSNEEDREKIGVMQAKIKEINLALKKVDGKDARRIKREYLDAIKQAKDKCTALRNK